MKVISTAYAMGGNQGAPGAQGAGGFGDWSFIIMMVVIFGIFYFLMIRPQQKKQKELKAMLDNLAYGDTVMTSGGIHGKVTGLADAVITLEIADKVRIKVARSAIGAVLQKSGSSTPAPTAKP
ncbi:MAG TPA: preprotein translocase subunit YajC [Syntrophaceae bacterium]|nr:preprotein translocase subunit YajC [Syntrophaceae bacterium]